MYKPLQPDSVMEVYMARKISENQLTLIEIIPKNNSWERQKGLYQCSCGKQKEIAVSYVKSNHTKSCGCLRPTNKQVRSSENQKCSICGQSGHNKTYCKKDYNNKKCSICKKILPIENFSTNGMSGDGKKRYSSGCKECKNINSKDRYRSNWRYRLAALISSMRNRKFSRDLEVCSDIDIDFLQSILEKQNYLCYYTKLPLKVENTGLFSLSLDRKDSSKGYIKDNIVLCLWVVNRMKLDIDLDLFYDLCQAVVDNKEK